MPIVHIVIFLLLLSILFIFLHCTVLYYLAGSLVPHYVTLYYVMSQILKSQYIVGISHDMMLLHQSFYNNYYYYRCTLKSLLSMLLDTYVEK